MTNKSNLPRHLAKCEALEEPLVGATGLSVLSMVDSLDSSSSTEWLVFPASVLIDSSILPSLELSRFFGYLDALLDDGIVVASSGTFVSTRLASFRGDILLTSFK